MSIATKKRFNAKIWFLAVLLMIAVSCFALYGVGANAYANAVLTVDGINEFYSVGDKIEIPDGKITVGGKESGCDFVVVLPNGTVVAKRELTLDDAGEYAVKYSATIDGRYYECKKTFVAKNKLFSVKGENGSAVYSEELQGIDLKLEIGETFRFNKIIDLNDNGKTDELIKTYVLSSGVGIRDFEYYVITLTDIYDETNNINLRVYASDNFGSQSYANVLSYASVSVNGASEYSAYSSDTNKISKNTSRWGNFFHHSFSNQGQGADGDQSKDTCSWRIDYAKNKIYLKSGLGVEYAICETDSYAYYDNPWSGFKSGLCYLSITCGSYINSSAHLVINNIDGIDLTGGEITDEVPPQIKIETGEYGDDIPFGTVGNPYKIFGITATDDITVFPETGCKVYCNYYTDKPLSVEIKNGAFTPDRYGVYTVVYTAVDGSGNKTDKLLDIAVKKPSSDMEIAGSSTVNATAGEYVTLEDVSVNGYDEDFGALYIKAEVETESGKVLLYDGLYKDYGDLSFRFMQTGNVNVVYTAYDYTRSVEKKVIYNLSSDGKPKFMENINEIGLPEYFVAGNVYTLPTIETVDFSTENAVYKSAKIKVVGNATKEISGKFTPDFSELGENIKIVYYAETDDSVTIDKDCKLVNAFNGAKVDQTKLFITDKVSASAMEDRVRFIFNEDGEVKFVNGLQADGFSFVANTVGENSNFDRFDIVLTDSVDKNNTVVINFAKGASGTEMYLNGNAEGKKYNLAVTFTNANSRLFEFTYNNSTKNIAIENYIVKLTETLNGGLFAGFDSGSFNLTVKFYGVTGDSAFDLFSLNGQPFSNGDEDFVTPKLALSENIEKILFDLNEEFTLPKGLGYDVFCGESEVTVSLRLVGGGFVKTKDGKTLNNLSASEEYTVVLDKYGDYSITYLATDRFENEYRKTYKISVLDRVKPEIKGDAGIPKEAKVGDKVNFGTLEISDNADENIKLYITVLKPDGNMEVLPCGEYTFDEKGKYEISYFVVDASGNITDLTYETEVK